MTVRANILRRFFSLLLLTALLCAGHLWSAMQPVLWNIPVSHTPFWGRSTHLHEIQAKVESGPLVLTGLSGMGKSRLSYAYAKKHAHVYRVVWVFDASKHLGTQMIDFANRLYTMENKGKTGIFTKSEDATHYVKTLLRTCSFSWLLIFDAAPSYAGVKEHFPETFDAHNKHVIVSSLSDQGARGVLRVDALSDQEAHDFLRFYLKDEKDEDIAALARLLGNHPLALLQAATYITATPNMNIVAYSAFFTKNKKAYWVSESQVLGNQPQLYTAINMSIAKLKEASPQDYSLLVALCLMDTHQLDGALIQALYTHSDKADMGGFGKILGVSLITKKAPHIYVIHDYVRDVVLATVDAQTYKTACEIATNGLLGLFSEKTEDCVEIFEKDPTLLRHLKTLITHMDDLPETAAFGLGVRVFYYCYYYLREYSYVYALSDQLSAFLKSKEVKNTLLVANFHSANAYLTLLRHGMKNSLDELHLAKASFEKLDPSLVRSELVMLYGNNYGFTYYWLGDLEAIEMCVKEAARYQEGYKDPMGLVIVGVLRSLLAQDRGQFDESLRVLNGLLANIDKDPTENKVMGHFLKSLKACSLLKVAQMRGLAGDQQGSERMATEALKISQDAYTHAVACSNGREDTDIVARTLIFYSLAQSACGQHKEAEKSARRALTIFERELLGPYRNRRQAIAHMALGDAYMGQKKYAHALAAYLESEKVYGKICTHKTFDDISELYVKIVRAADALKDAGHRRLYAKKHHEAFGVKHPRFDEIFFILRANGESAVFES